MRELVNDDVREDKGRVFRLLDAIEEYRDPTDAVQLGIRQHPRHEFRWRLRDRVNEDRWRRELSRVFLPDPLQPNADIREHSGSQVLRKRLYRVWIRRVKLQVRSQRRRSIAPLDGRA